MAWCTCFRSSLDGYGGLTLGYTAYDLRFCTTPPYPLSRHCLLFSAALANKSLSWAMFQDRPCKRCIKRNIGHLCHDEPRENHHRKSKSDPDSAGVDEILQSTTERGTSAGMSTEALADDSGHIFLQDSNLALSASTNNPLPVSSTETQPNVNSNAQPRKCSARPRTKLSIARVYL